MTLELTRNNYLNDFCLNPFSKKLCATDKVKTLAITIFATSVTGGLFLSSMCLYRLRNKYCEKIYYTTHSTQVGASIKTEKANKGDLNKDDDVLNIPKNVLRSGVTIAEIKDAIKTTTPMVEKISWSDPALNSITIPTDKGLALLAAYYTLKYNTPILLGHKDNLERLLEGHPLPEKTPMWGVIKLRSKQTKHVTPILCFRKKRLIQRINLDSINIGIYYKGKFLPQTAIRQADCYSCRTDALIVLRDAMRDIRSKKIDDLYQYVHAYSLYPFYLPAPWARSVQISKALAPNLQLSDLIIPTKTGKLKTLKEHQLCHTRAVEKTKHLYVYLSFDTTGFNFFGEKKESIRINTYLNAKGKKHTQLIHDITGFFGSEVNGVQKKDIWYLYRYFIQLST